MLGACASPPEQTAPESVGDAVEPAPLIPSTTQGKAWGVYRYARTRAYDESKGVRHNPATDDYRIELRARAALAGFWRDERPPDTGPDPYLDLLVALDDQGRLPEHVLASLLEPGWTIPAEELAQIDLAALAELAREPIQAPTFAVPEPRSGEVRSVIPGEQLPDPLALHPDRVPCAESLPTLRTAIRAWEQERDGLDGAPAAAENRAELLQLLSLGRGEPPFATRGMTWVSPKPHWLLFVAGFCAIEHEDYDEAEQWLESAVAMAPHRETARLELVHALVSQRKLDRADAVVGVTLSRSQDRCELARAWRKRGYIRFEQRRLSEAEDAYHRSLDFDPESGIAHSELDLLQREIAKNGGTPKWYVPPASHSHVTKCPPS